MRIPKTYLAVSRLISTIDDAERQIFDIKGLVKQLPKDWYRQAIDYEYDDDFQTLLEMMLLPSMIDRVNLTDFLIAYKSLKSRGGC
jgi:hypothetical protein